MHILASSSSCWCCWMRARGWHTRAMSSAPHRCGNKTLPLTRSGGSCGPGGARRWDSWGAPIPSYCHPTSRSRPLAAGRGLWLGWVGFKSNGSRRGGGALRRPGDGWMAPGGARSLQVIFNPRCCGDRRAVALLGVPGLRKVPKVVTLPWHRRPRAPAGSPEPWGCRCAQGAPLASCRG